MFSKSKESSTPGHPPRTPRANGGPLSIIAADVVIVGNIVAGGEIQLDGTLQGDISCAALTLGESGRLTGGLTAEQAVIRGEVHGSIGARTVVLERTATVVGDVTHQSITIEAGARIDGRFIHADPSRPEPAAEPETGSVVPLKAAE